MWSFDGASKLSLINNSGKELLEVLLYSISREHFTPDAF